MLSEQCARHMRVSGIFDADHHPLILTNRRVRGRAAIRRVLLASVSAATLTVVCAGSASAQTWTGTTSNDWTVGANWNSGVAPTSLTAVTIDTSSPNPTVLGVSGLAAGVTRNIIVGSTGTSANLTIQNGSTLTSTGTIFAIGSSAGSAGTVTVTGAGSRWILSGAVLRLGNSGTGTLNIENGARVIAQNGLSVGSNLTGSGTVNISGGGTLETSFLRRGAGAAQTNFDNGILQAQASNATFITGFSGTQLNILAGGLTIDTGAFTVGTDAASAFTGAGGLTKIGTGTLNLAAGNTYAGETVIQAGALALTGAGAISNSNRVVANGTFDVSGVTAAGTSIQSLAGSGAVTLGTKDLTITNANDAFSGIISGSGGLTISGGTQTLSGANNYTGATNVNGGTLRAGAANIFGTTSAFNVASGGTFDLAGFNQTLTSLDNAGMVTLGGAPGTTLTVTGNYVGNGGTVQLNTQLGGDNSPTDLLRVQGDTSGSSSLRVNNVGGTGAQTVNGIKVIDVVGASNGTFALLGNYVINGQQAVVGGAYAYTLQKNGVATPGDGDWYLRSSLINPLAGAPAGPLYQPGVPLYENYAQMLLRLNELPTFRQRVGDRYEGGTGPYASAGTAEPGVVWGRIDHRHDQAKPSTTTGSTNTSDVFRMQAGLDGLFLDNPMGRLFGGINVQYGTVSGKVFSFFGNGKISIDGYSVGTTLTWLGHDGFYVDAQGQLSLYDSDLKSSIVQSGDMVNGNEGWGRGLSIEAGKRFGLGGGWSIVPQAQLVYSAVRFDSFQDRFAAAVALEHGDSLIGRLGLSPEYSSVQAGAGGPTRMSVYGLADLYYQFEKGTLVSVADVPFSNANERLWGGLGIGGAYNWAGDKYALFGEFVARTGLEEFGDSYNIGGTLGFRAKF